MTFSGRTIAKNAGVLMSSQLISWGLSFLLAIFLPRYLGPQGIGQILLANSLWAIVAVIAGFGTETFITKEIARSPGRLNELLGTTLALRALIFMLGALAMAVYVQLAGYPAQTVSIILIIGISSLVGQLSGTYDAALKGLERMEYTALAAVVFNAFLSFLQIGLLLFGYGVVPVAAAGIIANFAMLAIEYSFLRKLYSIKLSVRWGLILSVIQASLPYCMVSIGIVLYHQFDAVVISLLADEKVIGWYGAAARLYGTLLFIPNVIGTALFPALSRAHSESPSAVNKLAQKSLSLFVMLGVPVGLGMAIIANQLVVLLFGAAFANSGPVLAVRGILLILTFVNMLLGFLLISKDRQKSWACVMLIAAIATIPLDLILIPWTVKTFANGALGGALSFVFTEVGMTMTGLALLPRGTFSRQNAEVAAKVILAGVVMAAVTWIVRDIFILIPIAVGAVTYVGMVAILRAVPKEDWDFFLDIGSSFIQRLRGRFTKAVEMEG